MADLPPRLSDRQQFVLAWLTLAGDGNREWRAKEIEKARDSDYRSAPRTELRLKERGDVRLVVARGLSRAVADEFDGWEDNPRKVTTTPEDMAEQYADELDAVDTEDEREAAHRLHRLKTQIRNQKIRNQYRRQDEILTKNHRTTHSRTLDRLADRELVKRWKAADLLGKDRRPEDEHRQTTAVRVTDAGERAGREILRRHNDGRYALSFDALDTDE